MSDYCLYDARTGTRLRLATETEVELYFNVKAAREGWPPSDFPDVPADVEEVWVDLVDPSETITCWHHGVPVFRGWLYQATTKQGRACKAKAHDVARFVLGEDTRYLTIAIDTHDCALPPEPVLATWLRETPHPKTWTH